MSWFGSAIILRKGTLEREKAKRVGQTEERDLYAGTQEQQLVDFVRLRAGN